MLVRKPVSTLSSDGKEFSLQIPSLLTMIQSWMWFMYLYEHRFWSLSLFKDFLHSRNAVISTAYMPFVDIRYCAFWIMGVFYFVEFPFLLWYISTKVMAMDRLGLNRRQCMLYMLKSVGYAGMVLFMQVLPVYIVFQIVFLIIIPLFVLHQICLIYTCIFLLLYHMHSPSLSSLHHTLQTLLTTLLLYRFLHPG